MALIDSEASEILIRLVYDGPPEAGKTTSLRALASSLSRPTYSPAEDAAGRTLWFDWMEYVGGRFEGCQIRCQIVSVAGQRELAARRRRVIAGADVVVFVADSAAREAARTVAYLEELRAMLEATPGSGSDAVAHGLTGCGDVPVGVILQANKRDLPDAISMKALRAQLEDLGWPIGVVESIASEGTGIREAFVYAVRLALDRARAQLQRGGLPTHGFGPRTADELLTILRADDEPVPAPPVIATPPADSLAAELIHAVLASEAPAPPVEPMPAPVLPKLPPLPRPLTRGSATVPPRLVMPLDDPWAPAPNHIPNPPTTNVPSGAIWPPVEGRALLQEISAIDLLPRRLAHGDWVAGLGSGWRVMSSRDALYPSLDHGRNALIQWARLHATAAALLSDHRCIVLADDGTGRWRLWQLVRAEPSLRDAVDDALFEPSRDAVIAGLRRVAQLLVDADAQLASLPIALPCTLDNLGPSDAGVAFIGFMPDAADEPTPPRPRDPLTVLLTALEPVIAHELVDRAIDLEAVIGHLQPSTPDTASALLGA